MKSFSGAAEATEQPSWGQTVSKAAKLPVRGWTTTAGSPVLGSLKVAEPPTATAAAVSTFFPGGRVAVGPGLAVVTGVVPVGESAAPAVSDPCPTSRPTPAASPARSTPNAP